MLDHVENLPRHNPYPMGPPSARANYSQASFSSLAIGPDGIVEAERVDSRKASKGASRKGGSRRPSRKNSQADLLATSGPTQLPQLEMTSVLPPVVMDQLTTEIGNQLCLRYLTSGPPYATVIQSKQALKDAAMAAKDILNIHCKIVVLLIICLLTSLPALARYPPQDATSIARSWSVNLSEIRGVIYLEGPASFGVLNANCMIDGPRDATTAQVAANVHHLIGRDMRFLFLIDPKTVGQK